MRIADREIEPSDIWAAQARGEDRNGRFFFPFVSAARAIVVAGSHSDPVYENHDSLDAARERVRAIHLAMGGGCVVMPDGSVLRPERVMLVAALPTVNKGQGFRKPASLSITFSDRAAIRVFLASIDEANDYASLIRGRMRKVARR